MFCGEMFLPAAVIFLGVPLHDSVITAAITTRAEDKSNAAAFMTFVGVALGVVAVLFVGRFSPKNAVVMPSMFVVIWALLVVLCLAFYRVRRRERI